jgi:hypothetical protein
MGADLSSRFVAHGASPVSEAVGSLDQAAPTRGHYSQPLGYNTDNPERVGGRLNEAKSALDEAKAQVRQQRPAFTVMLAFLQREQVLAK